VENQTTTQEHCSLQEQTCKREIFRNTFECVCTDTYILV